MQTGLDRRTFLTRAAAAGGGLLSMGAVERLVARDALGHGRRTTAEPYGPLRRGRGPARRGGPRAAGGVQLRDVQPRTARGCRTGTRRRWRSTAWARSRAGGSMVAARITWCGSCATPRTATRPARSAACWGTARRRTTRRRSAAPSTLVYDEHRRELVQDFVSLNGTTVNCAGGISYRRRYWLTGEETVGGPDSADPAARFAEASRLPVPDARRARSERARGRRPDPRGRPVLARGGGGRPGDRHRLRDRGPGLRRRRRVLPLHPGRSR